MSSFSHGTLHTTFNLFTIFYFVCLFRSDLHKILKFRILSSGGLAGGLYPFSFRIRQSRLLAAMVLIVSDGESS